MAITKDHIGGLIFLCLSVAYGYYAQEIPLLPGEEFEPFTPQTMPNALAFLCGILSIALIISGSRSEEDKLTLVGLRFRLIGALVLLVVIFALALEWLGFLVSTIIFLVIGYRLLGERRPKTLFLASVPFACGLWFILTQLLDIYLAPGRLMMIFGG